MVDQLLSLGDYSRPKPRGYYFDLYEWVEPVDVVLGGERHHIDPRDYFVTSGEAVIKCSVLENDLWNLYQDVTRAVLKCDVQPDRHELRKYYIDTWKSACQAHHLMVNLTEARGPHLFLETDWVDGKVVCYPKNPRGVKF